MVCSHGAVRIVCCLAAETVIIITQRHWRVCLLAECLSWPTQCARLPRTVNRETREGYKGPRDNESCLF